MPGSAADTLDCGVVVNGQMSKTQTGNGMTQQVTIAALEGRTGEHEANAVIDGALHLGDQPLQPLDAIGIRQRRAGTHARNVFFRMEMIGFDMPETQGIGNGVTGVGLTRTADAHDHQCSVGSGKITIGVAIHYWLSSSIEVLRYDCWAKW